VKLPIEQKCLFGKRNNKKTWCGRAWAAKITPECEKEKRPLEVATRHKTIEGWKGKRLKISTRHEKISGRQKTGRGRLLVAVARGGKRYATKVGIRERTTREICQGAGDVGSVLEVGTVAKR